MGWGLPLALYDQVAGFLMVATCKAHRGNSVKRDVCGSSWSAEDIFHAVLVLPRCACFATFETLNLLLVGRHFGLARC